MSDMKRQSAIEFLMSYGWVILLILIIAGVLAYYGLNPKGFLNQYHSETKAFDVSQHMRCDFYLEYRNDKLINVTKTDCIVIP
jgi:hypothetical protein